MEESSAEMLYDGLTEEEQKHVRSLMKSTPDLIYQIDGAGLYLGNLTTAGKKDALKACGIQVVLQVSGEDTPPTFPEDFEYHCFTFGDTPTTPLAPHLERAVRTIHKSLQGGKSVFVHCAAGVSRSASLIMSYLLTVNKGWDYATALQYMKERRPCVGPNEGFKR